ncbi:alpha-D-ribose 1-methylphosphonate 5-triphosphate synthase subunit PhnG [Neorhizobium huautlense]|uniref:Alpha-D-ribose 1-methylphosphonate 5-triphosphate synthase subunit PhnG n=1 Tax=Neorhizobium huautlense TaxID=67774 RepID=A0ABT9PPR5_9HYPH|nr:phosphonate C-P lyase system protein PhnG [Neorhizobium huautlense]MDP9836444.1 alpha-D-ribose 1-methylphosphonate 5-triphosphate synthase subunit PhnG [Neorhizobium huautlense]
MTAETANARRKRALDAMASMPANMLSDLYKENTAGAPGAIAVRGPEIGAIMLRGRIGGGGAPFNLGEASVTRATVRLDSGELGHSIVLGRDADKARMIAHLDALRQLPDWIGRVEKAIVEPALEHARAEAKLQAEETEATRVDFFTMVRGED